MLEKYNIESFEKDLEFIKKVLIESKPERVSTLCLLSRKSLTPTRKLLDILIAIT